MAPPHWLIAAGEAACSGNLPMPYYRRWRKRRYRYTRTSRGSTRSTPHVDVITRETILQKVAAGEITPEQAGKLLISASHGSVFGGVDEDVRRMFFGLDQPLLKLVFCFYEQKHGARKREYAERTFESWRSGSVQMGGEISERLLQIVPQVLSFDQKYELIEKLWKKLRTKSRLNVTISAMSGTKAAVDAVMDAIDAMGEQDIPVAVSDRLDWLASADSKAAMELLQEVSKREALIATETLEAELERLSGILEAVLLGRRRVRFLSRLIVASW